MSFLMQHLALHVPMHFLLQFATACGGLLARMASTSHKARVLAPAIVTGLPDKGKGGNMPLAAVCAALRRRPCKQQGSRVPWVESACASPMHAWRPAGPAPGQPLWAPCANLVHSPHVRRVLPGARTGGDWRGGPSGATSPFLFVYLVVVYRVRSSPWWCWWFPGPRVCRVCP